MGQLRWGRKSPLTGLVIVVFVSLGFLAQRQITSMAFDHLERDQVSQDAQRIRIALDYEVRLPHRLRIDPAQHAGRGPDTHQHHRQ